jgi:glycosyltransferase involved in cell wall biosynthesis
MEDSRHARDPDVSVAMAVRDGLPYVHEAIESIREQTFTGFELIVIDDGSTDGTWEALRDHARTEPRMVLLRNDVNRGQPYTRNRALEVARGRYFAVQDADDVSFPRRLERQREFLEDHPTVGGVGALVEEVWPDGRRAVHRRGSDYETLRTLLLLNNCIPHTTLFARTALLRRLGGYRLDLLVAQDYDLWWRMAGMTPIACLDEVLARYRTGAGTSMSVGQADQQRDAALAISRRAVREAFPEVRIDWDAYARFWRAFHGERGALRAGDIDGLGPLWDAIAERPVPRAVFGHQVLRAACRAQRGWGVDALRLTRLARDRFHQRHAWRRLVRAATKTALPDPVVRGLVRIVAGGRREQASADHIPKNRGEPV